MSEKTDARKARQILKNGFTLPAEIEEFLETAKKRAVESTMKVRATVRAQIEDFKKTWSADFDALPEGLKVEHDMRYIKGEWVRFERPMDKMTWRSMRLNKMRKMMPYGDYDDACAAKFVEEECDKKRVQFIIRTNAITGDHVTGATLMIDRKSGDVNGTITGDNGTASVKTIGAGGYNIQRYHFRCLIRKVK